jgi:hypothetical protein
MCQLFSVGFTIAISSQVSHGLGSPLQSITQSDYITFQKAGYASQILYLGVLAAAKLSTLALFAILTPLKSHRIPIFIAGGIVAAWSVSSILGSAFQCSLPNPYLYTSGKCFNQNAFWYGVGAVNILTDLTLMAFPVMVVSRLKLPLKKKIAVTFAFSFRLLAIGCTVFRLVELPQKSFRHATNITLESWLFTIATQLEVFFSVFATCVPHLRPFIESVQSGYLGGAIREGERQASYGSHAAGEPLAMRKTGSWPSPGQPVGLETQNSVLSYASAMSTRQANDSIDLARNGQVSPTPIGQDVSMNDVGTTISAGEGEMRERGDSPGSGGRGSHESAGSAGSAMVITTTQEWTVSYQE